MCSLNVCDKPGDGKPNTEKPVVANIFFLEAQVSKR